MTITRVRSRIRYNYSKYWQSLIMCENVKYDSISTTQTQVPKSAEKLTSSSPASISDCIQVSSNVVTSSLLSEILDFTSGNVM